jgi:hypothetical protein
MGHCGQECQRQAKDQYPNFSSIGRHHFSFVSKQSKAAIVLDAKLVLPRQ